MKRAEVIPILWHCLRIGMLHSWGLQDTLEDLADTSGTEFEIPAGFDEQVHLLTCHNSWNIPYKTYDLAGYKSLYLSITC